MGFKTAFNKKAFSKKTFNKRKIPRDLLLDPPPRRRRWWILPLLLIAAAALLLVVIDTRATPPSDAESGQLLLKSDSGWTQATHLETSVDVRVTGIVARTTMRQSFRNDAPTWQEAVYIFPLNDSAAVFDMQMHIGDRVIRSRIEEREQARRTYETAKQQGRKAALTEQQRPNLFTQSVANIPPGEHIDIVLTYLETVDYDNGQFSLRLPLTLTPRYIPGSRTDSAHSVSEFGWAPPTDQVQDAPEITPYMRQSQGRDPLNPVSINVVLDTGLMISDIASPYHQIRVVKQHQTHAVSLARGSVAMDRDFVLDWRPVAGDEPQAAIFRESAGTRDYALLMIVPPSNPAEYRIPRDTIFIIDTSGSMEGTSIVQARASLLTALDTLHPEDRFNIIQFNSHFTRLFNAPRPADRHYIHEARGWIDDLDAGGGTEMMAPLKAALNERTQEGYFRQVIFITDGAIGNEAALFALIEKNLGDARLFTVGIGSAPNSYFMRKSAEVGGGSYTHIGTASEVKEKMEALYRKIESPLVDNIQVRWNGSRSAEHYPSRISTLYAGEPLIITARGEPLFGDIEIEGRSGDTQWLRRLALPQAVSGTGIGTLWARAKVAQLEDEKIMGRDVRADITAIALEHHLVTRYTSLVAVEAFTSRPGTENIDGAPIPNAVAKGQVISRVMYPRTATRAPQSFFVALVLLLVALPLFFYRRRWL